MNSKNVKKMELKKVVIASLAILALSLGSRAQETGPSKKMGLGFHLAQYQNDFGLGLNVTSPYFAGDQLALRFRGNNMWYEHIDDSNETTWSDYTNVSLGLVVLAGNVGESIRLYGEGGIILIQPSENFSTENSNLGGYGLFGFEFYFHDRLNYHIEIGGIGTGAVANEVLSQPIYSNGMSISVGFRMHF